MLGIAWVETTRDGTKIGFLLDVPALAKLKGMECTSAVSDVTVVLVVEQVVNASWRSNKKREVKEK